MKIIFTDIDGVYNTPAIRWAPTFVREDLVLAVSQIAHKHGARVVITSSWRDEYPDLAKELGFPLHKDWRTILRADENRGCEVQEWLSRHPKIKQYVIIDDHNDFLNSQQGELIWTCTDQGLTVPEMQRMEAMLDKPADA